MFHELIYEFGCTKVPDEDVNETKLKIWPHTNGHEFEAQWASIGQGLPKSEKYSLVPGLSMNFFFGFYDAKLEWAEN